MSVGAITESELVVRVRNRLRDGWVLLDADTDALQHIEDAVYAPGTDENANYEVVLGLGGYIALGKKTELLRQFLSGCHTHFIPPTDDEWEGLLALECAKVSNDEMFAQMHFKNPRRSVDDAINSLLSRVFFFGDKNSAERFRT